MEEKSKGKQYLAELSIIELLRRQVKIAENGVGNLFCLARA